MWMQVHRQNIIPVVKVTISTFFLYINLKHFLKHWLCDKKLWKEVISLLSIGQPSKAAERIMLTDFVHRPMFFESTTFRKLDLFLSSGKKKVAPTLVVPEDGNRSSFQNVVLKKTLKKYWTLDKVRKHYSFKCNAPSSESFRINKGSFSTDMYGCIFHLFSVWYNFC
jgi:hypothetical protein